jgi:ubiquinone/menaquinone biosynthesis C-methylase UbiE
VSLRDAWDAQAGRWAVWARTPGHDSYWLFHRERFFELLPAEVDGPVLDVGCGEGRVTRELRSRGWDITGIDASPAMIQLASEADPGGRYGVSDAAALPFDDDAFELVIAFMSLQDVDDPERAIAEAARVLRPGGLLCAALVHPLNSAGRFISTESDSPFVIAGSYLESWRREDDVARDGLEFRFYSEHRPLDRYARALEAAGFTIERIREVTGGGEVLGGRWDRIPLFLHIRARSAGNQPAPGVV